MAITIAPELFSQDIEAPEMFPFPWLMAASDRSALVPAGANAVTIPDLEGSVTVGDYVAYNATTDVQMTDTVYKLTVNNQKYTNSILDDIDTQQKLINALGDAVVQSNREQMVELSKIIRVAYRAAARLAVSGLTQPQRGAPEGLTANAKAIEQLDTVGSGTAHAKWDTPAARAELMGIIDDAYEFAQTHGWSERFLCVAPVQVITQIRRFLRDDKPNLGAGAIVDSAFTTGKVPFINGCEFFPDTLVPLFNVGAVVAANAGLRMDFVNPGRGAYYVRQFASARTEMVPGQFGIRYLSLMLSGAVQGAARNLWSTTIQLSAS